MTNLCLTVSLKAAASFSAARALGKMHEMLYNIEAALLKFKQAAFTMCSWWTRHLSPCMAMCRQSCPPSSSTRSIRPKEATFELAMSKTKPKNVNEDEEAKAAKLLGSDQTKGKVLAKPCKRHWCFVSVMNIGAQNHGCQSHFSCLPHDSML